MKTQIIISKTAAKDYESINEPYKSKIKSSLEELRSEGLIYRKIKALTGELKGLYSIRVGKYRIIYYKENGIIYITAILHRKEAYK